MTKKLTRLEKLTRIVTKGRATRIDGMLVDQQTANVILLCHKVTKNDKVKVAIETAPIEKVGTVCWKAVK